MIWETSKNKWKNILFQKLFSPFTVRINFCKFSGLCLKFQIFFSITWAFFRTESQNNFGNKIPFQSCLSRFHLLYASSQFTVLKNKSSPIISFKKSWKKLLKQLSPLHFVVCNFFCQNYEHIQVMQKSSKNPICTECCTYVQHLQLIHAYFMAW